MKIFANNFKMTSSNGSNLQYQNLLPSNNLFHLNFLNSMLQLSNDFSNDVNRTNIDLFFC